MRRIATGLMTVVTSILLAGPALAQENYPPNGGNGHDPGVGNGTDLAFTGADIGLWAAIGLALIALGAVVLWSRRRLATQG